MQQQKELAWRRHTVKHIVYGVGSHMTDCPKSQKEGKEEKRSWPDHSPWGVLSRSPSVTPCLQPALAPSGKLENTQKKFPLDMCLFTSWLAVMWSLTFPDLRGTCILLLQCCSGYVSEKHESLEGRGDGQSAVLRASVLLYI